MGQGETLMPTWEADEAFLRDYRHLTPAQKEAFKVAKEDFVKALLQWESMDCAGLPQFPARLGVKPMVDNPSVLEVAWASDGRATWHYGKKRRPDKVHVVWRRIGTHDIYKAKNRP